MLTILAVQGEAWEVTQSLPFLTPGIVREKGFDSVIAKGGEGMATKNDEYYSTHPNNNLLYNIQ